MSSTNVNAIVKEAVRALKANNRAEARSLLEKATELDPYNEQAWLWLSGVVETEEDQRTCLQNVLFVNPGNENAQQGLAMLEAKAAAKPPPEPEPTDPEAFADFELPSGDDWLAELDEMRQTAVSNLPATNPFSAPVDEFDDVNGEAFADPFGDPFSGDGPFSAGIAPADIDAPITAPNSAAKSSELEDDLETLFGSDAVPMSPVPAAKDKGRRGKPKESEADPLAGISEDADAGTLFSVIPKEIKPTRLPGEPPKAPVTLRILLALLVLGNVAVITLIFLKVTA